MPIQQAYGTWSSNITPKAASDALRLSGVQWDNASGALLWVEGRGARGVLVCQQGTAAPRVLTGSDCSVRALVGYGGGDFTVRGGVVVFAGPQGRLYRQSLAGGTPQPITPAFGEAASPALSPDGRWVLYVHSYEGVDRLLLVDSEGRLLPRIFAEGTDFVMQPTWHPAGTQVAYVVWDTPNMPWDGTTLCLASISHDTAGVPFASDLQTIAGDANTAIFNPQFAPDGRWLAYASDQTGWNQLYRYDLAAGTHRQITTDLVDHATPAWVQGLSTFTWLPDSQKLAYLRSAEGLTQLCLWEAASGQHQAVPTEYTFHGFHLSAAPDGRLAFVGSAAHLPARVVSLTLSAHAPTSVIHRRAQGENHPVETLAQVEALSWQGQDGETAYGLYYPPTNPRYTGVGAPPLIVIVHGGPTSQVRATYQDDAQIFTSRGFAVLYPNHRGSTGYGRAYMNKLRDSWGIYDVQDSQAGAQWLVDKGLADPRKLVILGGSAGGYTVLQSLVDLPGFYKAGVCLFGVSNQFALAADTHKFEARYTDMLLGPLPQAAERYRDRSPLFHAHKITDPMIVFQGEDDKVVPRDQSDTIVASLKARGIPHEYHVYAGEGHGWRKPETIDHYYTAVLRFLKTWVVYA